MYKIWTRILWAQNALRVSQRLWDVKTMMIQQTIFKIRVKWYERDTVGWLFQIPFHLPSIWKSWTTLNNIPEEFCFYHAQVTGVRLMFLWYTNRKLKTIYKTAVFRFWTRGSARPWYPRKRVTKEVSPTVFLVFYLEATSRLQCRKRFPK